jgi:hypothetical protein
MVRTGPPQPSACLSGLRDRPSVKVLARAHHSMIWSGGRQTNALRSTLRAFYPAALIAFEDLTSTDALEVPPAAPTPELSRGLSRWKIVAALGRSGRQRRIDERAREIQTELRVPQLAAPAVVSTGCYASSAMSRTGTGLPSLAKTMLAHRPSPGRQAPDASSWPVTPATNVSPMPSICGPSQRSRPRPEHAPSTTPTGPPETPTTPPYEHSATASASSTAASNTTPSMTRTSPRGHRTDQKLPEAV